jgi:hypothetical protein
MTVAMKVCEKCDQEVVKRGWFWVVVSEAESKMVTGCPEGGNHEVEDDEDE